MKPNTENLTHYRVNQLARTPKGEGLLPVNRSTIWRWVAEGIFPKPIKLSPGATAWRAEDVHAWIESRQLVIDTANPKGRRKEVSQ